MGRHRKAFTETGGGAWSAAEPHIVMASIFMVYIVMAGAWSAAEPHIVMASIVMVYIVMAGAWSAAEPP